MAKALSDARIFQFTQRGSKRTRHEQTFVPMGVVSIKNELILRYDEYRAERGSVIKICSCPDSLLGCVDMVRLNQSVIDAMTSRRAPSVNAVVGICLKFGMEALEKNTATAEFLDLRRELVQTRTNSTGARQWNIIHKFLTHTNARLADSRGLGVTHRNFGINEHIKMRFHSMTSALGIGTSQLGILCLCLTLGVQDEICDAEKIEMGFMVKSFLGMVEAKVELGRKMLSVD